MLILDQSDYFKIRPLLAAIPFNKYFAQAVQQNKSTGTIYVDEMDRPKTCLIFHPYGMLLLCGNTENAAFNQELVDFMLHTRHPRAIWLQVYPETWSTQLETLLKDRLKRYPQSQTFAEAEKEFARLNRENVMECTRVNFKFNSNIYLQRKSEIRIPQSERLDEGSQVCQMDEKLFQKAGGAVVPQNFWKSYADFAANGAGFCVTRGETVLSVCSTAFVIGDQYEIGIETHPDYRGKGYARLAARAFIDYCLVNNHEPVWSCRKENVGSYKLAQELGFQVTREYPCYGLVNNSF